MNVLVTGGAGYIGSHCCVELLNSGHNVIVVDDLSNSCKEALDKVEQITNKKLSFYQNDLRDKEAIKKIFEENKIDSVIHFAGFKAVGESSVNPLKYYDNNIIGSIVLLEVMAEYGVNNLIFSSSATVYGAAEILPISETAPLHPANPYGRTKLFIEEIIKDYQTANPDFNAIILRYFNPVGAHKSGLIGENSPGKPNNLMPYINKVAFSELSKLYVFGSDYDTPDGSGIRDYIHVVDLCIGHVKALEKLESKPGFEVYNLGTGEGYSVLEVIKTFEDVNKVKIPYEIAPRREGDIAICYADPSKAKKEMAFVAKYKLAEMCEDSMRFQSKNPKGYTLS